MKPFSICIIAKNEEENLDRCLGSVKDFDCEIIVVDTGSTDKTKEIAAKYGAKIYDFPWINDFSAARNFSLEKASYDWVLVLDCDEWMTEARVEDFMELGRRYPQYIGRLTRRNILKNQESNACYVDKVERFFNRRYFHYEGSIHEQVTPVGDFEVKLYEIPLVVMHDGYVGSKEDQQAKHIRNTTLLLKEVEKNPNEPYLYFQLGQEYFCEDDYEKAVSYYEKVLEYDLDPKLEYLQMTVIAYGQCLLRLGRYEDALLLENIYEEFCVTADFPFLMGRIYYFNNKPISAMKEFLKAMSMEKTHGEGCNMYLPRYFMALINEQLGDKEMALTLYGQCGDFAPAKERMAIIKGEQ